MTDLEIAFGERNAKEWTRVRRDGALITIKENPQQAVKPTIVRFSKMWTIEPDTTQVRLIVRDRMTGRFGVLDMPLSARFGRYGMSASGGPWRAKMGRGASCVSLFLFTFLHAAGLAQSPPDAPTFKAGTTLIEFTVVATGEDGRHVTDLKQDDVSIVEGGQPRDVAFFHYEGAPPAAIRVRAQPLPPGIYTNRPEYAPGPPRNITAILIDSLNTRAEDQVKVLAHIMAFVSAVPSDTRVAIYRTGERVHVIHDFTDDVEGLRKRLLKDGLEAPRDGQQGVVVQQMVIEPWQAEAMAATMEASLEVAYQEMARVEERSNQYMESRRVEFTMSSLEAVGNHLAGIPGRKNLIWMTSGVPAISAQIARSVAAELHRVAAPRRAEAREPGHCDVSRRSRGRQASLPQRECGRAEDRRAASRTPRRRVMMRLRARRRGSKRGKGRAARRSRRRRCRRRPMRRACGARWICLPT